MFGRYKANHAGEGPLETAYGAFFPHGILGRRGLSHERDLTDQLIDQLSSQRDLSDLSGILEVGRQPMSVEQHRAFRAQLAQGAADLHTINSGHESFVAENKRLLGANPDDAEQLSVIRAQGDVARGYLASSDPQLRQIGAAQFSQVLEAQHTYATANEAQRIQRDAADAAAARAMGEQTWQRFQLTRDDLRSESTAFLAQRGALGTAKALLQSESEASDYGLLYSWNKMLDPGSAVREGEFANAQNLAGVPPVIVTLLNQVRGGERLTPEKRADIYKQMANLYRQASTEQAERNGRYASQARGFGVPDDAISSMMIPLQSPGGDPTDFGTASGPSKPGAPQGEDVVSVLRDTTSGAGDLYHGARRRVADTLEFLGSKPWEAPYKRPQPPRGPLRVSGVITRPTND